MTSEELVEMLDMNELHAATAHNSLIVIIIVNEFTIITALLPFVDRLVDS